MFHFQGNIGCSAIGTVPSPFFQQILPHFVPQEGPLLVFDAGDRGILKSLRVEADMLHTEIRNRSCVTQLAQRMQGLVHPSV